MAVKVFPSDQQAVKDVSVHLQARLVQETTGAACCWRVHKHSEGGDTAVEIRAIPPPRRRMATCRQGLNLLLWLHFWGLMVDLTSRHHLLCHVSKVTPRVCFPLVLSGCLSKAMVKWRQVSFLLFERPGWQHQERLLFVLAPWWRRPWWHRLTAALLSSS